MAQCSPPRFLAITSASAPPYKSVTLNWTGAQASVDSAITGYQIYRSTTEGGTYTLLKTVSATQTYGNCLVETNATVGGIYWYKILTKGTSGAYDSPLSLTAISLTTTALPSVTWRAGKTNARTSSLLGEISIQPLSDAREDMAAASIGGHVLFAGGYSNVSFSYTDVVETYDNTLTRGTATALSVGRSRLSSCVVGDYALFAGGFSGSALATVDAYDSALTRSTPTALSSVRDSIGATSVGSYALFAGGDNGTSAISTVNAYNESLTRSTPTALSAACYGSGAASVGTYALFAGGYNGTNTITTVNAYNESLTRSTPTALSTARTRMGSASIGVYAIFAGGGGTSFVETYNESLVRANATSLSVARSNMGASTIGGYAIIAGGNIGATGSTAVDAYDASLTRTIPEPLSHEADSGYRGASNGTYAVFAGNNVYPYRDEVNAYDIALNHYSS